MWYLLKSEFVGLCKYLRNFADRRRRRSTWDDKRLASSVCSPRQHAPYAPRIAMHVKWSIAQTTLGHKYIDRASESFYPLLTFPQSIQPFTLAGLNSSLNEDQYFQLSIDFLTPDCLDWSLKYAPCSSSIRITSNAPRTHWSRQYGAGFLLDSSLLE